jgi:hypothetical protein
MIDLIGKQLQLLREIAPRASRIGVISLSGRTHDAHVKEADTAAPRGVKLHRIVLREPLTLDDLSRALTMARVDAVLGLPNPALDDARIRIV